MNAIVNSLEFINNLFPVWESNLESSELRSMNRFEYLIDGHILPIQISSFIQID